VDIWQWSFDEPARIVANVGDDMFFGIEPGASHDGGVLAKFTACPVTADYPEQRAGQPPTSKIKTDNVDRELVPKIRAALGVSEYIQILHREYLLSDVTEPGLWSGGVRIARSADAGRNYRKEDQSSVKSAHPRQPLFGGLSFLGALCGSF
jgi:hypothetical protein